MLEQPQSCRVRSLEGLGSNKVTFQKVKMTTSEILEGTERKHFQLLILSLGSSWVP